jgi:hypothetical protein
VSGATPGVSYTSIAVPSHPRRRATLHALLLIVALASAGCRGPRSGAPPLFAQPGWGWRSVPQAERMSVRAVPAAARPSVPVTRLFRPGWGRRARP